jgi:hypothetical protein
MSSPSIVSSTCGTVEISLAPGAQLLASRSDELEKDQRCCRSRRPLVEVLKVESSLALKMYPSEGLQTPRRGTQGFLTLGLPSLVYFLVTPWIPLSEGDSIVVSEEAV